MTSLRLPMALLLGMFGTALPAAAQNVATPAPPAAPPSRPVPPTRDPATPGYVAAKELPDGAVPPADADGNFIIGPTHTPAPEMTVQDDVPQGRVFETSR